MTNIHAWVGLGSNLGESARILSMAIKSLGESKGVVVEAVSSLYRTAPQGLEDQPDFLNAVARVRTDLKPDELLNLLLQIETDLGRERTGVRFGPRTIDLDLLLYGEATIESAILSIPHPRMHVRRFVLEPLAELEGDMIFPDGSRLQKCLQDCAYQQVIREGRLGNSEKRDL